MGAVVIAAYTPKAHQEGRLRELLRRHVPILRQEGLATQRPHMVLRSRKDGTYLEIFEWVDDDASTAAHSNVAVRALWKEFEEAADLRPFGSIEEAGKLFAHFDVVGPDE